MLYLRPTSMRIRISEAQATVLLFVDAWPLLEVSISLSQILLGAWARNASANTAVEQESTSFHRLITEYESLRWQLDMSQKLEGQSLQWKNIVSDMC